MTLPWHGSRVRQGLLIKNGDRSLTAATQNINSRSGREPPARNARTRSTTASTGIPVVSSRTASALATRGEAARVMSRSSRSAISSERAARVAATPFSFNWLWRLKARSSRLAVRKILTAPRGIPRCPCPGRRPPGPGARRTPAGAPAAPPGRRERRRPWRRRCPADSVRMSRVTSAPSSQTISSPGGPAAEAYVESGRQPAQAPRHRPRPTPPAPGRERHQPVQGAAVEQRPAQSPGDRAADGALAGPGGSVDGDDDRRLAHGRPPARFLEIEARRARESTKPGKEVATLAVSRTHDGTGGAQTRHGEGHGDPMVAAAVDFAAAEHRPSPRPSMRMPSGVHLVLHAERREAGAHRRDAVALLHA